MQKNRAREGYDLGLQAVDRLSSKVETRDHIIREMRDDNQGLRDQAFRTNTWRTQYENLCKTTADEATSYQNALLKSTPSPPNKIPRAESERRRVQCDATAAELSDARGALDRSRRELEVARAASQPLQDDIRCVSALLVAHAEEHQRDVTRIRDLETSSSAAEAARVSAQADRAAAQASVLPIASRATIFPSALVDARRAAAQLRVQIQDRERRLTAPRAGRESARLVRDALVTRLSGTVTAVGGSLNVTHRLAFEYGVNRGLQRFYGLYHGCGRIYDARVSGGTRDVASPYRVFCVVVSFISHYRGSLGWPLVSYGLGPRSRATFPVSSDKDSGAGPPAHQRRRITPPSSDPASDSSESSAHSRASGGRPVASTGGRLSSSDSDSGDGAPNGGPVGSPPAGNAAPAVRPFFAPVMPPFQHPSASLCLDFPDHVVSRSGLLGSYTANRANGGRLLRDPSVGLPHATHPAAYLRRQRPHFDPFLVRYDVHLDHWSQAYWELTHEFPVPNTPAWTRWCRRQNSRPSHAGDHLVGTFQLLLILFQAGRVGMDVLLDVMVLLFRPGRSGVGRWYPDLRNSTLETALADIDERELWRRFFRTQPDAAGNSTVEREHPAYAVRRLASKFVERGQPQPDE
ncbi:hypothetical protein PHMEG_00017533 [Phytophthora megakarya]|uniref:Uncharacterized protein n=1 Tax=Phytophthora megakarya TaxID=4795 RepID=A0A225VYR2_9STRA|nr:hypothetical protein PHMEG_00017533 [Phytophthora megakarya]